VRPRRGARREVLNGLLGCVGGARSGNRFVDHGFQISRAGILVGLYIVGPGGVHIELAADELSQILVRGVGELADDVGCLGGQRDHVVVGRKNDMHLVDIGGNGVASLLNELVVGFGSPVGGEVGRVGNSGPPVVVREVDIVFRAAEHVAEPAVLAAAVAVAVSAVDGLPVIGALIGAELAVGAVLEQILALAGGNVLNKVEHTVGICAAGRDEVVGVDPRAGIIDLAVVAVGGQSLADGEVVGGGVGLDGSPGCIVEVAELAGIAKAEVHSAQLAGAEVGVCVIKVALDTDVGVKTAGLVELGKLLDNSLAGIGGRGDGPLFGVGSEFAGEDGAGAGSGRSLDAGALRQSKLGVDLSPVGQFVVAGPPADVAGLACGFAVGHELIDGRGDLAAVDLVENGLVVDAYAREGGLCERRDGVDSVGGVLIAGIQLVVSLVFRGVDDLVQGGVAVGVGVDNVADVGHKAVLDVLGDLVGLAPGREEIGAGARVELGLHPIVEAVGAGIVFHGDVEILFNLCADGIIGIAVGIVEAVAELREADVDIVHAGVVLRIGRR